MFIFRRVTGGSPWGKLR